MYTVLLVDDEAAILNALQYSIPWEQFGVDKLFIADDGLKAWEIIRTNQVDLLITDIQMPNLDGLSLLKLVRESYSDIHCILLTAYGEFEYARTAIQLGVENYLLKPFKQDEMEETIEKALDNIYARQGNPEHLFRNNILLRWAGGTISPAELSERSALIGVNTFLPCYCVICIRKKAGSSRVNHFYSQLAKTLAPKYEVHSCKDDKKQQLFIVGGKNLDLKTLASEIRTLLNETAPNIKLGIAIGSIISDSSKLSQSYQTAVSLLDTEDLSPLANQILITQKQPFSEVDLIAEQVQALFQEEEEELRLAKFRDLALSLTSDASANLQTSPLANLRRGILKFFSQEFPGEQTLKEQLDNYAMLSAFDPGGKDMEDRIVEILEYSYLLYCYQYEQLSPVIRNAIDYIHSHYHEGLSLKEFCSHYKMNTHYLGFLFKKETGIFFNNYLAQYRISRSLKLLRDTDLKINGVAEACGFSSASYYITCFKRQTGMSPIGYRNLMLDADHYLGGYTYDINLPK